LFSINSLKKEVVEAQEWFQEQSFCQFLGLNSNKKEEVRND